MGGDVAPIGGMMAAVRRDPEGPGILIDDTAIARGGLVATMQLAVSSALRCDDAGATADHARAARHRTRAPHGGRPFTGTTRLACAGPTTR